MYFVGVLVIKSCPTLVTPWAVASQAPLSVGFPRQESYLIVVLICIFLVLNVVEHLLNLLFIIILAFW